MPLYTPFMTKAMNTIGDATARRDQNRAYASAYMNKPGAMEQLMQLNPQMAYKLQQQKQQSKQQELVNTTNEFKKLKAIAEDRREFFEETKELGAEIETYPEFETFLEQRREMLRLEIGDDVDLLPPATPEMFEQVKQIYGSGSGKLGTKQQMWNELTKNLTGKDLDKAKRIELQLDSGAPKIFQAAAKTFNIGGVPHIIDAEGKVHKITVDGQDITTTVVAQSKKEITAATETGKLTSQLKFKPMIADAVKLAEIKAKEKGEVLNDLGRMEASLPGVRQVVDELIDLSHMATSTLGGRAFDFLIKESGFGAVFGTPKGADARAKLIAIVDNQVLPLLRETFGAAFTKAEGDTLRMALVDPNSSPSQKREQLESFLAQKERNVRAKQAQLDEMNKVELSDEDLLKKYGG